MKSFYKAFEDRFRGSRELISDRLKVYLPLIEPLKALYPNCLAVDLGCGRGEWVELLQVNGFKSHGIDTDEGMLENAAAFGLSTELGDALDYLQTLADDSVCIVSGFHIAEHLPFDALQDLVKESLRVLKPAGILILETPNPENISVGSNSFYLDPTHVRPLPPMLLSFLPEYYGFSRVNVFRLNSFITETDNISLMNVINGVSPDYSVIAQKNAAKEVLAPFNDEFHKKHGFAVDELAAHYEKTSHGRQELENLLQGQVQREQAIAVQIEAVRSQAVQQGAELTQSLADQRNALQQQHAERDQTLGQQLDAEKQERLAREQMLREQTNQTQQEVENLLQNQMQREQAIAVQIEAVRIQAVQQSAELAKTLADQKNALQQHHAEREQTQTQHLDAEKQERLAREQILHEQINQTRQELENLLQSQMQREQNISHELRGVQEKLAELQLQQAKREKELAALADQGRQELKDILRKQVQREQDNAAQLLNLQQQAAKEMAELGRRAREQEHALISQNAELERAHHQQLQQDRDQRDKAFIDQTSKSRQELKEILATQVRREQDFSSQLLNLQRQTEHEKAELARASREKEDTLRRYHAEKEQALNKQLNENREVLRHLEHERAQRKREHAEQSIKIRQKLDANLNNQMLREQEICAQLQTIKQTAAEEAARLTLSRIEQERVEHRQLKEYETTLKSQYADRERALSEQHHAARTRENKELESKALALEQAQQLQAQLHGVELASNVEAHTRLLESCRSIEAQLKAQILSEQQTNLKLRHSLAAVQQSLTTTHNSLTWRATTPLRALASLFSTTGPVDATKVFIDAANIAPPIAPDISIERTTVDAPSQAHALDSPPEPETGPHITNQSTMTASAQATKQPYPAKATTLDELLAHHDIHFVYCAYLTLLGREPDEDGQRYYLGRLRLGFSKIQLIAQLYLSIEGKAYTSNTPTLAGLQKAVQRYKTERYPLIGWIARLSNASESNQPTARNLRVIENQLYLLSNESRGRFNQIENTLFDLHLLVTQQTHCVTTSSGDVPAPGLETPNLISKQLPEPDGLEDISPRARDIFFKLKTAASNHTRRTT